MYFPPLTRMAGDPGVFEISLSQQVFCSSVHLGGVNNGREHTVTILRESNEGAAWCPPSLSPLPSLPLPKGPASQRTTGPGAPDWKSVCMWGRLKRCADQTAQTFSVEESARWRAAPTRHHALQAPTDRLPTATRCTLHPSLAHCSLLWVSRFPFFLILWLSFVVLTLRGEENDRQYKL